MSVPATPRWRTWLQLLRAPNLFTVPGDPLAGFLLASGGALHPGLAAAIAASLCFYSAGLLLNDLADFEEDRRDRPSRPLPSGAAARGAVLIVFLLLAAAALWLCFTINRAALTVGLILLGAVVVYNLWSKRIPIAGPVNMGACRGLSLLLGAVAGTWQFAGPAGVGTVAIWASTTKLIFIAVMGVTIDIAAITHLARIETLADPPRLPRVLPFAALVATVVVFFFAALDFTHLLRASNLWLYVISTYTLYAGYKICQRLAHEPPPPIPPAIGQLIRLLLPLQALFCLATRSTVGNIAAILLLILWPISKSVSRRFYAS